MVGGTRTGRRWPCSHIEGEKKPGIGRVKNFQGGIALSLQHNVAVALGNAVACHRHFVVPPALVPGLAVMPVIFCEIVF